MSEKKSLDQYIAELLYHHDCVIIPGMGGIIGNYTPARISGDHTFFPPAKRIAFNPSLKSNDGLLADYITRKDSLRYSEAMEIISGSVSVWNEMLKKGESVILDTIGSLHLDKDNKVQFNSDSSSNFLLDSYGLQSFRFLPAVGVQPKSTHNKDAKVFSLKRFVPWALAPAAAFLIFFIPYKAGLINEQKIKGLGAYFKSQPLTYTERAEAVDLDAIIKDMDLVEPEPAEAAVAPAVDSITVSSAAADPQPVTVKETDNSNVYIIGGCFQEYNNAEKFMSDLKTRGYNAEIAGKSEQGFFRVSYNRFNSKREAIKTLAEIRKENTAAWVLAN